MKKLNWMFAALFVVFSVNSQAILGEISKQDDEPVFVVKAIIVGSMTTVSITTPIIGPMIAEVDLPPVELSSYIKAQAELVNSGVSLNESGNFITAFAKVCEMDERSVAQAVIAAYKANPSVELTCETILEQVGVK